MADPLGYSALDLAGGQQRIDQPPIIVHGGITFEGHDTGLGVDFDLGDMAAVRKGEHVQHIVGGAVETGSHARREVGRVGVGRVGRSAGDGGKIDLALCPRHGEPAFREDNLGTVGLQQMSRNFPAVLDDHLRRLDQCRPALMHRARAAMPGAALHEPRISLDEAKSL